MDYTTSLAHEIADVIVNEHGYTDDDARADERDRIEAIVQRTLQTEMRERLKI